MNKYSQKQIQTRITTLTEEIKLLENQENLIAREKQGKLKSIKNLEKQLESADRKHKFTISEHAIIRYYQRVCKVDFKELEAIILTDDVKSFIESVGGNCRIPLDGFTIVVRNYLVVTVLIKETDPE